ncbi:MAG: uroporphyrinogen decarboxylase [Alphaproteobacteria bacterium]|nr:uroporphyrinogen decarboxylase [Alphaproteobacteria bacterium]
MSGTAQPRKKLLRVLDGEATSPPPIWLMRQAGRYLPEYRATRARAKTFLDLCFSPDLACEVTLQPIRRYGFDAAILFSDILVIPYALGQRVWFVEGEGPRLEPVRVVTDLARLDRTRVLGALSPVFETVRRLRRELPAETALIGFAGAPWTVATYMVEGASGSDFAVVKDFAYRDAAAFGALLDLVVGATVDYLAAQVEAGAEVLQLFDSWAGVLSEAAFRRWVIAPTQRIVEQLKQRCPGVPMIGFPRGAGMLYADYVRGTGVDAVSLDTTVPLALAGALQELVPVQGNLDPRLLVIGGEAMRSEASAILRGLAAGPFVFNLGHGIVPETPPEHVAALVRLVREGEWQ